MASLREISVSKARIDDDILSSTKANPSCQIEGMMMMMMSTTMIKCL
jgi:hypothetical protein